jgi:hypothetical protein
MHVILFEYALCGIDGSVLGLELNEIEEYVSEILANIIESATCATSEADTLTTLAVTQRSPFGQYLMRNVCNVDPNPKDFKSIVVAAIRKWKKLSKTKKSAYR